MNGIQIEGEENDLKKEIEKRMDSIRMKIEMDKKRMRDSLQKEKEEIQQQLEKIAASKTIPEALRGYYFQSYLLLVNID